MKLTHHHQQKKTYTEWTTHHKMPTHIIIVFKKKGKQSERKMLRDLRGFLAHAAAIQTSIQFWRRVLLSNRAIHNAPPVGVYQKSDF